MILTTMGYTRKSSAASFDIECNGPAKLADEREKYLRAKAGITPYYLEMDWMYKHMRHCKHCESINDLIRNPVDGTIDKARLQARFYTHEKIEFRRSNQRPSDGVEKRVKLIKPVFHFCVA